jgi:hypothetical protein
MNSENTLYTFKRRFKSTTQRILLLESELIYDKESIGTDETSNENNDETDVGKILYINCKILGSTNKVYNIKLFEENNKVECSCSCLDFTMRKKYCKHLYWFGHKKFEKIDPLEWTVEMYYNFLYETFVNEKKYRKNENCPICLENIDYENEITINCVNTCLNSVHAECWSRNVSITSNLNCVICRSEIF